MRAKRGSPVIGASLRSRAGRVGASVLLCCTLLSGMVVQPLTGRAKAGRGHASQALAIGTGGAVTSVDADASRAGIKILKRGGNAVDAAVATAAALGVTEPYVAGIGGGGFMVVYLKRQHKVIAINGRETAPQAMRRNAFIDPHTGEPIPFYPQRVTTGLAVGVPGTFLTWQQALKRYGTMSLRKVLQPATQLARRGFIVDATYREQTQENIPRFKAFTPTRALYLTRNGRAPAIGSRVRNPDLANTYRTLARHGASTFYGGAIGKAIVHTVKHPPLDRSSSWPYKVIPGLMTLRDLRAYTAPSRTPTRVGYRGVNVYGMPPPSSGGSTIGEALNILEGFPLSREKRARALHQYIEASRLSFADRNRYVGDPTYVNVPLAGLLNQRYANQRRCLIGDRALTSPVAPGNPRPPYSRSCGSAGRGATAQDREVSTNHVTTADRFGNVVSYTTTIEQIAGSAITVPGRGFLLNNELTDFDPERLYPDQPDPNLPAGGKRPRSSMSPTIVLRDGRPVLALGSPGGATIITTVLQILVNYYDFGMTLPRAVAAPRASQLDSPTTYAEPSFISTYGGVLTHKYGQSFTSIPELGAATGIRFLPGGRMKAVAEPVRRGGGDAEVVKPLHRGKHH